jgi:phenylpropionate dioxygenase-like ring-hydroxylating dioxygenase large terminal subunit
MSAVPAKTAPAAAPRKLREPVLRDGTPMGSLVDRTRREVSLRVMSDPEIYELELKRIFARTWILVGHESEIPNPGDYVTRRVGEDPVILTRNRDHSIECLLNVCPHRGMIVARADSGNTNLFRCVYHGWMFNLDGSIRGVPHKEKMYSDCYDPAHMGLRKARVGVYAGLIFVNWDESAPSLEEYLGDFRYYVNLMFNRCKEGMQVLGPPQRFIIHSNWKSAAEQFGGDGYHAGQLHRSLGSLTGLDMNDVHAAQLHAPIISTKEGHNIVCFDMAGPLFQMSGGKHLSTMEKLQILPPPGVPPESVAGLAEVYSEKELEVLANYPPSNGGMFPHVSLWNMNGPLVDMSAGPFMSFRVFAPLGPDKFEFTMWVLAGKNATEEYLERTRRATSFTNGAAGFVEGDDSEVWPGQTLASKGVIARETKMKYWAQAGHQPPAGWPEGGRVNDGFWKDDSQWSWWSRYFDFMTGEV